MSYADHARDDIEDERPFRASLPDVGLGIHGRKRYRGRAQGHHASGESTSE